MSIYHISAVLILPRDTDARIGKPPGWALGHLMEEHILIPQLKFETHNGTQIVVPDLDIYYLHMYEEKKPLMQFVDTPQSSTTSNWGQKDVGYL